MPPSSEAIRRYKIRIGTYRDRTAARLTAAWDDLPGIDEEDIPKFEKATAAPVASAKAASVALSAAFFSVVLRTRPVGVRVDAVKVAADLAGPFRATWHALAQGRSFEEALMVGRSTAEAVAFDFVQSVARQTGDVVARASGRDSVKWVRVPGPDACDWCQSFEGVLFDTADAADFGHERDDCDVVPA